MRTPKTLALTLALITATTTTQAADRQHGCLRRIAYTESGGESLRDFAINVKAVINLAKAEKKSYCGLIASGRVKANRSPKAELKPYIDAVIATAIRTKADISGGANSWNRGSRPAYRGKVKRQTRKQVFYAKADYE